MGWICYQDQECTCFSSELVNKTMQLVMCVPVQGMPMNFLICKKSVSFRTLKVRHKLYTFQTESEINLYVLA